VHFRFGEQNPSFRPKEDAQFPEDPPGIGRFMKHPKHEDEIEGILYGEHIGRAKMGTNPVGQAAAAGAPDERREHRGLNIGGDYPAGRTDAPGQFHCEIPLAGAEIENSVAVFDVETQNFRRAMDELAEGLIEGKTQPGRTDMRTAKNIFIGQRHDRT